MSAGASILDQLFGDANLDWKTKVMRHCNKRQRYAYQGRRKGRQSLLFGIAIARAQKNLAYEGPKQQWNILGAIYTQ